MPNRIGSTIITALYAMLAGAVLAGGPAAGDDKCLAAPDAAPSPGSHWYYRIDRAQQRRCWYLGPEGQQARHAVSDPQPAAKSTALASSRIEAALPPPRPASAPHATAQSGVERFAERASEEAPAQMRALEPDEMADPSERAAAGAGLRQEVIADDKAATPAAAGALNAGTIILILIASAVAAAGLIHHATFGVKAARRRPASVRGGRAGRIASLASEKPASAPAARRPDRRQREPAAPIDPANIEEGIQRLVLALESRAA